ncbi:MAG TPA: MBL fold metallo-hydrolase [Myxococcaceae bacterium]|nr:MBL fold metallo-hydrolase [Myxococcaceae bacterium]
MKPLYLRQLLLGPMENFVYLLGAPDAKEVAVVDPAWDVDAIERAASEDGKTIASAVLSHSHFDHINGLSDLLDRHDIPVFAQKAEVDFSPELREFAGSIKGLAPGDEIPVGPLRIKALHTPGHTPGSQCFYCGSSLVSGDTLFIKGCGRCDLRGGDPNAMYRSLSQVLAKLPDETKLFPGHDYAEVPVSTIAEEKKQNPYFQFSDLASFLAFRMRPRR